MTTAGTLDTPRVPLGLSHSPAIIFAMKSSEVLSEWTLGLRTGDTDICLKPSEGKAMVIYPWWKPVEELRSSLELVKAMGFESVTDNGNLPGYTMPNIDTIDFDYIEVTADGR